MHIFGQQILAWRTIEPTKYNNYNCDWIIVKLLVHVWNLMDLPKSCFGETLLKVVTAILEKTLWKKNTI